MLKVGVTGGIGSGKSIVCSLFSLLGVPVFNSDEIAKKIVNENPLVIKQIIEAYGANVYNFGKLDRKKMAAIVFNDKEKLEQLNSIIHPAVAKVFAKFCEKYNTSKYIIKEAAIIFETGINSSLDKVITVSASDDIRIKRVMLRDGISRDNVLDRMKHQMPQSEKEKLADYIIENSGNSLVIPQVIAIHKILSV